MAWTTAKIQEAVRLVGEKAAQDQQFHTLVLDNPKEAIQQVMGEAVPENYTLKMIESDPHADLTLVVPPLQTDQLSDQELDQVAGDRECDRDCPVLQSCNTYYT